MWWPNAVELSTVSDWTRSGAAAMTFVPIMPGERDRHVCGLAHAKNVG